MTNQRSGAGVYNLCNILHVWENIIVGTRFFKGHCVHVSGKFEGLKTHTIIFIIHFSKCATWKVFYIWQGYCKYYWTSTTNSSNLSFYWFQGQLQTNLPVSYTIKTNYTNAITYIAYKHVWYCWHADFLMIARSHGVDTKRQPQTNLFITPVFFLYCF